MSATLNNHRDLPLTDQERSVLEMVRRGLAVARLRRTTGQLVFEVNLQDGGVTSKYSVAREKEK